MKTDHSFKTNHILVTAEDKKKSDNLMNICMIYKVGMGSYRLKLSCALE